MQIEDTLGLLSLIIALGALLLSDKDLIKKKIDSLGLGSKISPMIENATFVIMALSLTRQLLLVNRLYALIATVSALAYKASIDRPTLFYVFMALLGYEAILLLLGRVLARDLEDVHIGNFENRYRYVTGSLYLKIFSSALLIMPLAFHWAVRTIIV